MKILPRRVDFTDGYNVRVKTALHGGAGKLLTLSQGGCYVETKMVLLPQAQLSLALEIPELSRIAHLEAVVAWENRGPERPSGLPEGYGMRFIKVSQEAAESISWLLQKDIRPKEKKPDDTQTFEIEDLRSRLKRLEQQLGETAPGAKAKEKLEQLATTAPQNRTPEESTEPSAGFPEIEEPEDPDLSQDDSDASLDDFMERSGPPYPLRPKPINKTVPAETPGVYMLSYDRTMDSRVGRADRDLREALNDFVGEYAFFHFEPIPSQKERFERECELYHRLGGDRGQLDHSEHPTPPPGPKLDCPVCLQAREDETA